MFWVILFFCIFILLKVFQPQKEGFSVCSSDFINNDNYQGSQWYEAGKMIIKDPETNKDKEVWVSSPTLVTTFSEEMPDIKLRYKKSEGPQYYNSLNESDSCINFIDLKPPEDVTIMMELSCRGNGCKDFPEATTIQDSPVNTNYFTQFDEVFEDVTKEDTIIRDIQSDIIYATPEDLEETQEKRNRMLVQRFEGISNNEIQEIMDIIDDSYATFSSE